MDDLRKETKQKKFWTPMNGIDISHSHFQQQQQTISSFYRILIESKFQSVKERKITS